MGPNNANQMLQEIGDVSYITSEGREITSGILEWGNDQAGSRLFKVVVKPHAGWEIQKKFVIVIYDIQGFPATDGKGEASPTHGSITLIVSNYRLY